MGTMLQGALGSVMSSLSALPPTPRLRGRDATPNTKLLADRTFVADMALLCEQLVMNDMPLGFWAFDATAPDAAAAHTESASPLGGVRARRARLAPLSSSSFGTR